MWKRVVAPTILVSILWIAVSFVTTHHLQQVYESHARTLTQDVPTIEAAWAMRRDMWKLQATVLEQSKRDIRTADKEIREMFAVFESALGEAERTSFTPREQELVNTIRQQFDDYRKLVLRLIEDGAKPEPEKTSQLAAAVADSARNLLQVNQELVRRRHEDDRSLHSTIRGYRLVFMVAGPLIGVLFGLLVARGLSRSLSRIRVTLSGATGELGSVAVSTPDDLPALQSQADIVAGRIRQVVGELEAARRKLVQSERLAAVGELAAGVAHEIRNPLTSVKLLIQAAAQRKPIPTLSPKQFEVVLSEILRMEQTIQGLLDFARPPRLRHVPHDVRQTIRRALNLVQLRAEQQQVRIVEAFAGRPLVIDGDPEQLHAVFVNLAINSVEAMPDGGVLRVAVQPAEGACRITFTDSGEGISPEVLARLFEPFVTSKERGTGLGLAISRRVVQEHGGALTASNNPQGGAELAVMLPLATGAPGSPTPEPREETASAAAAASAASSPAASGGA